MEKMLKHLVKTTRIAYRMDEELRNLGYGDTPYWNIYCEMTDAIYEWVGEKTQTFDESITYAALMADTLTDDQRVMVLQYAHDKNTRSA